MKIKLLGTTIAASIAIMLAGSVYAGNYPNTARTLTGGIGSGTTHGRIPASHPGTKSRASAHRNSHATDYMSKYRSGLSHRPSSSVSSAAAGRSYSSQRPGSVPAADRWNEHAEANARNRIPASLPPAGGGNPGSGGSASAGIPSSGSAGMPTLPPSLPDAASAGRVPTSIPPAGTGGGMPSLPASRPDAAAASPPPAPPARTRGIGRCAGTGGAGSR